MCYRLLLASPLTLSEIRSMLPDGATADLAPPSQRDPLLDSHAPAQTVVVLTRGGCACDLLGIRAADERELRAKYRAIGARRSDVIAALDRHRRPGSRLRYPVEWPEALARFTAEHARNAGPSLYYLQFSALPEAPIAWDDGVGASLHAAEVLSTPGSWLVEERPTLVLP